MPTALGHDAKSTLRWLGEVALVIDAPLGNDLFHPTTHFDVRGLSHVDSALHCNYSFLFGCRFFGTDQRYLHETPLDARTDIIITNSYKKSNPALLRD